MTASGFSQMTSLPAAAAAVIASRCAPGGVQTSTTSTSRRSISTRQSDSVGQTERSGHRGETVGVAPAHRDRHELHLTRAQAGRRAVGVGVGPAHHAVADDPDAQAGHVAAAAAASSAAIASSTVAPSQAPPRA